MSELFNSNSVTLDKPPRRIAVWLIPLLIFLALLFLLIGGNWQKLFMTKEVDVCRVRLGESSGKISKGEILFQAAGWIQADPYPLNVTALISGVVEKIYVIDGETVKKGQLLVKIIDEDLKLSLKKAEAHLKELELDFKSSELQKLTKEVELTQIDSLEATAKSTAERLKHKAESLRKAHAVLPLYEIEQAELEYKEQLKVLEEFNAKRDILKAENNLLENATKIASGKITTQNVVIEEINLAIKRTEIHAPVDGIIEKMYAREGRKQMLEMDHEDSATVAKIFQPDKIRVRVDVPLSDVHKLKIGQKTEIFVETLDKPLNGIVRAFGGQADYQKNTLEINVQVLEGNPLLRPEMLAQVKFLQDENQPTKEVENSGLFVMKKCLQDNSVWVVSQDNQLIKKTVQTTKNEIGEWIEISSGLNAGEKVVLMPDANLKENGPVKIGTVYE